MPLPNLDQTSKLFPAGSPPPAAGVYPVRRRYGLNPSPFLPPNIQMDLQPLFDTLTALHIITHTPEFSSETSDFLIDCIEHALNGTTPDTETQPTAFTLPALRLNLLDQAGKLEIQWALRLTQAARRDISRPTCANWSDLMLYCRYAAEPLGRAVLQICGIRNPDIEKATDALTAALLVLHLLRTAGEDWRKHGRCYLPTEWIAEEGGTAEQLVERKLTPALRQVVNRMLERTEKLLVMANTLPSLLATTPALKAESVRLLAHAACQLQQLKRHDSLVRRLHTPLWLRLKAHFMGWLASRT